MPKLVIVESPAKAKTISRFLGRDYIVEASYGHIRDLPQKAGEIPESVKKESWARMGVNLDAGFEPVYVVPEDKKKQVAKLKKALKDADELLLATDEDREGESISWHLLEVLKPKVPVRRIVFHEITPEAIAAALAKPRDVDTNLVQAQESRRIVDRLYGYSLSPVLWKKVQTGLSAGRVQSVAVRLVVEREEERRAFVRSAYWDLEARVASPQGEFKAVLASIDGQRIATGKDFDGTTGKLKSSKVLLLGGPEAKSLADQVFGNAPWRVASVEKKPGVQRPAPPFTTSTLQQEANRKLGFSATRTMRAAQNLYEGVDLGGGERVGLITYMRTDSFTLSERALAEAQSEIKALYGPEYARGPRHYKTKSRNAQEAHEAIRPTKLARRPQEVERWLGRDEMRVYELVWKRTVASQMPDAEVLRTTLEIAAKDDAGREARFAASGKEIRFPGYLRAYVEGSDDPAAEIGDRETVLPELSEGDPIAAPQSNAPLRLAGVEAVAHETQPPARYTEASLVKKLEEEGVGRPSTYASIISTIQARGYVFNQGKALVPTFTAMAVTNLLREHFGAFVDLRFTARMEEELDEVALGQRQWKEQVSEFYRGGGVAGAEDGLEQMIAREIERIGLPDTVVGVDADSGRPVAIRIGRYGPYALLVGEEDGARATVPAEAAPADFTVEDAMKLIRAKAEGPRVVGHHPDSGQPIYAALGRFGPYVQLGEAEEKGPKPRRASLPKGVSEDEVDLATAVKLLSLPRVLGAHPDDGAEVLANIGRFGPYVQHNREFRSLKDGDDPYTVGLDRALELLAQPKGSRRTASKSVLKELGEAANGGALQVLDGRYGPYVSDGKTHATLPKGADPAGVTREQGLELIAAKGGARKSAKKAAKKAAKKGARKSAKKAAKKAAKKSAE